MAQNTGVRTGAMQNTQVGGRQWPASPSPHHDGKRPLGAPYPLDHGNEEYPAPADASSTHPRHFGPQAYNLHAGIKESAVPDIPYHQVQWPMFGATTQLPAVPFPHPPPFRVVNNTSCPPTDMQDKSSLPVAPTMPHVNPRFFNLPMGGMPPPPFPMLPFNPLLQFQGTQPMSTFAGSPATQPSHPPRPKLGSLPVKIPVPSEAYIQQASQTPKLRSHPQPLLIILDLNGTLIFRKHKKLPPSFARRAGLDHFLEELTEKYSVMIWSSSKPATVSAICKKLFPNDRENSIVAMWGRDKFGLTNAQYNTKLQVYKELHKVWADPNIQAAYPGSEPDSTQLPGGKFSKRKKKPQQNDSNKFRSVSQRWNQTNTILIDDSKIKALSEPYNILEIPEFTGNPSTDESTLFANVLEKLEILSHHEDVSKMLRLVNELAEKVGCPALDVEFPFSERGLPFDEEDVSDGGVKLVPTKPKGNDKKPAAATQAQPPKNTAEGTDIAAQKKAAKKARKKAKKEAKAAAQAAQTQQAAAKQPASTPQPANTARNDSVTETTAPNAATSAPTSAPAPATNPDGSVKLARRETRQQALAARRRVKALAQQSAPAEPVTAKTGKSYDLRKRDPSTAVPATEAGVDTSVALESIDSVSKQVNSRQRDRSPSSASDSSRNSLLDRLEDGLGIRRY